MPKSSWILTLAALLTACSGGTTAPEPEAAEPAEEPAPAEPEEKAEAETPGTTDASDKLKNVIRENSDAIKSCYKAETEKGEDEAPQGRLELSWTVAGGKATSVAVTEDSTGSESLQKCVTEAVSKLEFPEELDGGDVSWPFVFASGEDEGEAG